MASITSTKSAMLQARARPAALRRPVAPMPAKRSVMTRFKIEEAAPCLDIEKGVIAPGGVCIVTGGNRGIGREIVLALAGAGQCKVAINHIPEEKKGAENLLEVVEAVGGEAICIEGSVCCQEDVHKLVKQTVDKWGKIDVLVNNAAIMQDAPLINMTPEQWHKVIETDLTGSFLTSQAVLKHMKEAKCGRIVNITSVNGAMGNTNKANYMAAKAGMIGLTRSIAAEFAHLGITCNAVAPGFIDAPMMDTRDENVIKSMVPMGRAGSAAEVAGLVRYLALDPSAAYITGHTVVIDGGMLMC